MDTKFLTSAFSVLLFTTGSTIATAQHDGERRVRIDITRNENGNESHVTREFDLSDERQLADALRELGVMDELNIIGDDENLVLDLRRMRDGGLLNDMSMALSLADLETPSEPRAYLGVYYGNWNESCDKEARKKDPPVKEGACVTAVESGTPAEGAGLKDGDVIIEADGRPIRSGEALGETIAAHRPGDTVELVFYRGKEKKKASVTLGERSEAGTPFTWDWRMEDDHGRYAEDLARAFRMEEERAFLGVNGEDLPDDGGVRVTSVTDSSAAQRMGIREGDAITALNGKQIDDFEDLSDRMDDAEPDSDATVTVLRDGKEIALSGKLGRRAGIMRLHGDAGAPFGGTPFMFRMPSIPEIPYDDEDHATGEERRAEREEMRREMDELRREMDRLRRDLRGEVVREMSVTVDAVELTPEENAVLKNKGVAGLDKALDLPGLRISPNPTGGSFELAFEVPERGDLTVDVHDANGDRLYHETITGFKGHYARSLDMSDRAAGTYSVVIAQNGKALARKVVKR